jgi:hypothetical protein
MLAGVMSSPPLVKAGDFIFGARSTSDLAVGADLGRSRGTLMGMNEPYPPLAFWREEDCDEKYAGR